MIEKDYYCSLILHDLIPLFREGLAFKGGTCLSKVYQEFYRLSEDLDFSMSIELHASRGERRKTMAPVKQHLAGLCHRIKCFETLAPFSATNESTQYQGRYCYRSAVLGSDETIKLEIGIREPFLEPTEHRQAHTVLLDPIRNRSSFGTLPVAVLSIREAYAEKARAALTRREPAIRDFYDLLHAVQSGIFEPQDPRFLKLVQMKLNASRESKRDFSLGELQSLERQVDTQLKPVLRARDWDRFDLQRAFAIVIDIGRTVT
jgi:predicted nucleotidyltransferase component of viral defense system